MNPSITYSLKSLGITLSTAVIYLIFSTSALAFLIDAIDPAFAPKHPAAGNTSLALLNALPASILALALFGLMRRPLLALWLSALLTHLLYFANAMKLHHLKMPLSPADFSLLPQFFTYDSLLHHYVPADSPEFMHYSLFGLLTIALIILEPPVWRLRGLTRWSTPIALSALFASLLYGAAPWHSLYADERLDFRSWSAAATVKYSGLVASLLRYQWVASAPLSTSDSSAARTLIESLPQPWRNTDANIKELPDIVVVQSESFFDPARLRDFAPTDAIPHLRKLQSRSQYGDLWVPAFGGGTIRTEFEVLTGLAMRYFPQAEYPYFRLTNLPLPSLVRTLSTHGYHSLALHPHDPTFWNRAAALDAIGFSTFESMKDFSKAAVDGFYVSDTALTQRILERLPSEGPPVFIFAISMENHGPYDISPIADITRRDKAHTPDHLDKALTQHLQNYLYHLDNADRALAQLTDALLKRKRRTLLLFYGDHLPALPEIYASVGFDDDIKPELQPVPYIIFDTASTNSQKIDTASFFLPGMLLATLDIHDDFYFYLTEQVRKQTAFYPGWSPANDAGLEAISLLRQNSTLPAFLSTVEITQPIASPHQTLNIQ